MGPSESQKKLEDEGLTGRDPLAPVVSGNTLNGSPGNRDVFSEIIA